MVARGRRGVTAGVDVLVAGAGPSGLTTALQAHDHGASVRVVERRPEASRPSRAMIVHPRTLESLRPLGVAESLLDRGDRAPRAQLHLGRRQVSAQLAEVALSDTAYPHLTLLRQMDVEEVLADALVRRGVAVERGVELIDAAAADGRTRAILRADGTAREVTARFIVGCDGQSSTVRETARIGWRGGTYREEVVLADAEFDGDLQPGVLHVTAARQGLLFLFALGEGATWRLLATRPGRGDDLPFGQPGPPVPTAQLRELVDASGLGVTLGHVTWSARVRLQHRLADSFRRGPFFLVGDAAHTHSPAAAQGMNTGILDAVNLGWKLAFATDDAAREGLDPAGPDPARPNPARPDREGLLDSYEQERRPVARQVLALTHLVFFAEASTNPLAAFVRGTLVPHVAPAVPVLLRQRLLMAEVVRLLSQGWVRYRHSAVSVDGAPSGNGPRPGDRLRDEDVTCAGRRVRLHDLTARPGVHVLLQRDCDGLDGVALGSMVSVHRVASWPGRGLVAVRPDGHVGFRCGEVGPDQLLAWLDRIGARR